jgi:hypothetical protein
VSRLVGATIQGFRGIREGLIEGFVDVNILVGRNNSGKTSVIEAITRARSAIANSASDVLGRPVHELWRIVRNEPHAWPRELLYRPSSIEGLSVYLRLDDGTNFAMKASLPSPQHNTLSLGNSSQASGVAYQVFRPADGVNPQIEATLWTKLLADRADKVLIEAANTVFGMTVEQIQLPPDGRLLLLFPEHSVPLDAQGDGARSALRCLMVLAALRSTLLALEEPETFQHPGALDRFATAVCTLARKRDVQLVLNTHSIECVRAFLRAAKNAGSDAAVFNLGLERGSLEVRRLASPAVETLDETGIDVRSLQLYA